MNKLRKKHDKVRRYRYSHKKVICTKLVAEMTGIKAKIFLLNKPFYLCSHGILAVRGRSVGSIGPVIVETLVLDLAAGLCPPVDVFRLK